MEKLQHVPRTWVRRSPRYEFVIGAIVALFWLFGISSLGREASVSLFASNDIDAMKTCTIRNLEADLTFLDSAKPIAKNEFLARRDKLAQAIAESGADAFVVEPGPAFQYYANVSGPAWGLSERPFLMIVRPDTSDDGKVTAKTAFLVPHFEQGRALLLPIPSSQKDLDIIIWEESWSPYETLHNSSFFEDISKPTVMIDEDMRDFIVRGLQSASFKTVGLAPEVELIRQQKSESEIEILRAVNTGTASAVRAMRPCLKPDLTEADVGDILNAALESVGFKPAFALVLFDEHAANPHGGTANPNKKLTRDTMVLIDVGAVYLGYESDCTRSFLIEQGKKKTSDPLRQEKHTVWQIVHEAQTVAAMTMKPNVTAAEVDLAARTVIEHAGYGYAFTHRLGHSIGIRGHESPYLNMGNRDTYLKPGMVFTNEPGIYLEQRFGIRHEDVYVIRDNGEAELLTGKRATSIFEP